MKGLALVALLGCLGLVACGSNSLQGLGLSSSEGQLKSSLDSIQKAWDNVVADAMNVKTVNTDNIKKTYNELTSAVQNRPKDQPVQ